MAKNNVLGDLKHRAANVLEKELSRSERFQSFLNEVSRLEIASNKLNWIFSLRLRFDPRAGL